MENYISEDDIEQAILAKLETEPFNYNIIRCSSDPQKREDLNDGTGRRAKSECVLPGVMLDSLVHINPIIERAEIEKVVKELRKNYAASDIDDANYSLYNKIRNSIKIKLRRDGKETFDFVKLIDFEVPENNTFTAVSQMWIQGQTTFRRPDILIFVNGMPLVFIELKNANVKIAEAYNKNLKDYIRDIPNLFAFNQICVISRGLETRLGAFNAPYDYFFEWLKVESEKEKPDRKALQSVTEAKDSSIKYFVEGLLDKKRLIDYIENFVLFENKKKKIIAQNHQYIGVNNLMESMEKRKTLEGKLGVFWHTQGSGKSYSMLMFARKVKRKVRGNFTFLIITDREDLDAQIYKNFVRTEVVGAEEECKPKGSEQLRDFLKSNKEFIFTLIQKFQFDKTKKYPLLSERDDIIVLVDEAHRTQYKDLAENMRTGLPNANFVAFTGTPLLGPKRLTNRYFGNYVSEYNFAESVEDGSTVPILYSRRVPEVGLENKFLDDDVAEIFEKEKLTVDEAQVLEDRALRGVVNVIKRDERLDKVAQDIAHHFPRRGFRGKGMVVSVDKFTAVRMYDKVQDYWKEEKKQITKERNVAQTKEERDELTKILDYMENVEMAVVISEEADEKAKFDAQKLNISEHRAKMQAITTEGKDIEDRFKDPNDPLQLVFVCAMWLTGFDVKSLSTLYLDKPMKGHSLMQAIARANRVFPGKECGLVVDYVNVFKYMSEALSEYATGDGGNEFPAKDIDKLIKQVDEAIDEADKALKSLGIDLDEIIDETETEKNLDFLRNAYSKILEKDEDNEKVKVILNTLVNLYEAARPEISEKDWENDKFRPLKYLHGIIHNTIDDEKLKNAALRMEAVLDRSVTSKSLPAAGIAEEKSQYMIRNTEAIDLSKIDPEKLREEIKKSQYKGVTIASLKELIERSLSRMIPKNCTRMDFSVRYRRIIDSYNAGAMENEKYYEKLVKLVEELSCEENRANAEGLSEEELEIYDLLKKDKKLTKDEEQKVKLSAKNLYKKLLENRGKLFVVDWFKDDQTRARIVSEVQNSLNEHLPESYDKDIFASKVSVLMEHFTDMAAQGYGWIAAR